MALIALLIQNSGLSIIMRYSLVGFEGTPRYMTSTAVLMSEIMKLIIASIACFLFDADASFMRFKNVLRVDGNSDWLKLSVPSVLYTVQNSLQYAAMAELSAPVFQVLYQMKIITTAIFSVIMLSRHITGTQWGAVIALTLGVALVQLSQRGMEDGIGNNSFMGFVYVSCSCITSGFAGVYFEMVLKASKASIWIRNIQLSFIGIFIASLGCIVRDGDQISKEGFFFGYNNLVWGTIACQAAGGLLVAIVVKYADNVIKNFATSLSIIVSAVVSQMLFQDLLVNVSFVVGSATVLGSVYSFGLPSKAVTKEDIMLNDIKEDDQRPLVGDRL
eukprot:GSChrysophyteH1.ASY1.ANO1.397.1 assembled CDS